MRFISRPFSESRDRRIHRVLGWLAACILLAGAATLPGARRASVHFSTVVQRDETKLKVKAEGEGNSLTVKAEGETVIVDVNSRRGIGSATVEHASGPMPKKIVVRLRLKGLEEFRLSYDRTVITARVSSSDSRNITQSVGPPGGDDRPITPDSPHWMAIKIVSDQSPPRIPLSQGSFEVTLPKDVLGSCTQPPPRPNQAPPFSPARKKTTRASTSSTITCSSKRPRGR